MTAAALPGIAAAVALLALNEWQVTDPNPAFFDHGEHALQLLQGRKRFEDLCSGLVRTNCPKPEQNDSAFCRQEALPRNFAEVFVKRQEDS